jgi:hypothetical protein
MNSNANDVQLLNTRLQELERRSNYAHLVAEAMSARSNRPNTLRLLVLEPLGRTLVASGNYLLHSSGEDAESGEPVQAHQL